MDDIRDVKLPIDLPVSWWLMVLIVLLLAAVALVLIYWFKHRTPPPQVPLAPPAPVRSPWEIACLQLEQLFERHYPEQGMFKIFYSQLSDIVRRYLEDQFNIKAPEMTTEEFLNFVKTSSALKVEHKQLLKDFLNGCDMVKFAKYNPTVVEAQANFDLAKKLIMESKDGI